jgi:predicted RNase H-like HicB family nuclease
MDMTEVTMHYVAIVDGKGKVWGARFPDLPGVNGGGNSPKAAVDDAKSAALEWAAHVEAKGQEIPPPRDLGEILNSGEVGPGDATVLVPLRLDAGRTVRANLTFDAGLLKSIDQAADDLGITRSAFLASAAREKIEREAY